jgi:hypothetical protein
MTEVLKPLPKCPYAWQYSGLCAKLETSNYKLKCRASLLQHLRRTALNNELTYTAEVSLPFNPSAGTMSNSSTIYTMSTRGKCRSYTTWSILKDPDIRNPPVKVNMTRRLHITIIQCAIHGLHDCSSIKILISIEIIQL